MSNQARVGLPAGGDRMAMLQILPARLGTADVGERAHHMTVQAWWCSYSIYFQVDRICCSCMAYSRVHLPSGALVESHALCWLLRQRCEKQSC